jgi:hypothetical protein
MQYEATRSNCGNNKVHSEILFSTLANERERGRWSEGEGEREREERFDN